MKTLHLTATLILLGLLSGCQSSAERKQVKEDRDKRADFHYRLGIDALHKRLLPKAFEELILSDKIAPGNPETLDAIAFAWRVRGDTEQSKRYYEKALDHDAGAATRNNYGSLLIQMGEYREAIEQLEIALEDPRYRSQALAFVNMGDAYSGLGKLEEAVSAYRKAKLLSPNWSHPQLREAAVYAQFNRPHYAQALYETILRKEPNNQQAMVGLIALLKGKGKNKLVSGYIQKFIDTSKDEMVKAWAKDELQNLK